MADKARPYIYSAGFLASVGVVSALAACVLRVAKNKRQSEETSKLCERAVNAPFSADEWHRARARGDTADDEAMDEPDQEPQQPTTHPAMRGAAVGGTEDTFAIVFVGLPGRGKTAVAARTARYLSFFHGIDCELFNVGERRRDGVGYVAKEGYDFHDPAAVKARKAFSDQTLNEMKLFLLTPGRTAIFDASNITAQRRLEVYDEIKKLGKVEVIFVELISKETSVNVKEMSARDAAGASGIDSVEDYKQRVEHYQQVYEPIASGPLQDDHEHNFSYIKCIDHGKQTILNKIDGYMAGRIAQFITNCCHCHWTTEKRLFISRHGQSEYNSTGRIGGDSGLTAMGERCVVPSAEGMFLSCCFGRPLDPNFFVFVSQILCLSTATPPPQKKN